MSGSIGAASPATTPTTTPATAGAARRDGTRLSGDFNTFLTLLTTQLRNQDPMQPMDANALTQQLVQFSTVEQQVKTNATLGQLLQLQQATQLADAAALIGRDVTIATDRLPLQDGRAQVALPAAGRAATARIEIRDAANALVRTADVRLGSGATRWAWDGVDARGRQRADGAYRLVVAGRSADGVAVPVEAQAIGRVTGARREGETLQLRLGAVTAGYETLRELPQAP